MFIWPVWSVCMVHVFASVSPCHSTFFQRFQSLLILVSSFVVTFIYSFIHSVIHSFSHSFIHSFIIHSFIHSFFVHSPPSFFVRSPPSPQTHTRPPKSSLTAWKCTHAGTSTALQSTSARTLPLPSAAPRTAVRC